ncbi:MAG TPA: HAMP domain-containing sensor histidine kinase [Anaerolineales bacterium]|nr:HAMP domain-containing sensor histidine kinase [Anaerolineales bacterium]
MTSSTLETLARFELFVGLPEEALAEVARLVTEERHSEGELLFSEDSPANRLYLILSGRVSLEKLVQLGRSGTPRRATIAVLGPWQAIGWSSMVAPYIYTSSGICLEESHMLAIPGEDLRRLMASRPDTGYVLIGRVATIIRARLASTTAMHTYFLSIVSHELKRPIAAVENYIQITLGGYAGEISDKQRRLLERSAIRLSDLRALISDILDFARIQPDQIRADFEWVDPQEIGSEAIEEVRLAASQKNIRLKAIGPTQFKPIVAARRRLRQVISNLLANAVKFSPENSTVTLSASDQPEALLIEVLDEGIGIPTEDQAHIFDDFFRAANVGDSGGSGLGLSIAKKILDAHEGSIEIESPYQSDKSGTKVMVRIPRTLTLPQDREPRSAEPVSNTQDRVARVGTQDDERRPA